MIKNLINSLNEEELKQFMLENNITDIEEWLKPKLTFEQYLICVGSKIENVVTNPVEEVCQNIEHFRECYNKGMSAYKALILL